MITPRQTVAHDLAYPQARPLTPVPPGWVEALLNGGLAATHHECDAAVDIRTAGSFAYATTCIPDAIQLDALALRARVASSYLTLMRALDDLDRYPIRFWNFVPGIGDALSPDLDRYRVFNAGRYDAYNEWFGLAKAATPGHRWLGTASAVGITGSDLSIHCLAMDQPGTPVENPRQKPAWQYSHRYGPLPPCFSRAMIVSFHGRHHLLISGTASVVGEDSRHAGDLEAQLDETLLNIEALVGTATGGECERRASLQRLVDVRVYLTAAMHAEPVRRILSQLCPHLRTLDFVVAQVCRQELLVEIEGLAEL